MAVSAKKIIVISAVSAIVIIGVGFMFTQVNGGGVSIPDEFFTQRIEGAGAAKNVARLVSDSIANLKKIEAYDKAGDITRALDLVRYEQSTKQEKQTAAVRLSGNLEQMARITQDIKPERARELSVETVSTGVAMVSRLITYNSLLDSLLEALNAKFSGTQTGPSVKDIVDRINSEAVAINQLGEKFDKLMESFDRQFVN